MYRSLVVIASLISSSSSVHHPPPSPPMTLLSSLLSSTAPFFHSLFLSYSLEAKSRWASRRHLSMGISAIRSSAVIQRRKEKKVVVIMGPTGSGKSRLSVDLATQYFPSAEVINSDKIQVYRGLDITTNKIPMPDRRGIPHHLLGEFVPSESNPEFSPSEYRTSAAAKIYDIINRRRVPFVVGGSNSFIYALLANRFNPELDLFDESNPVESVCRELRYECCFLWVDVFLPVLNQYLFKRVDDMMNSGMLEELAEWYSNSRNSTSQSGLKKAIGVTEFARYFRESDDSDATADMERPKSLYNEAVSEIKENTRQLAQRQMWKIQRLREVAGWNLQRIDATAAFAAAMGPESKSESEIWEKQVVQQSMKIVRRFLLE